STIVANAAGWVVPDPGVRPGQVLVNCRPAAWDPAIPHHGPDFPRGSGTRSHKVSWTVRDGGRGVMTEGGNGSMLRDTEPADDLVEDIELADAVVESLADHEIIDFITDRPIKLRGNEPVR